MNDRRFLFSCGDGGWERDVGAITGDEMMIEVR